MKITRLIIDNFRGVKHANLTFNGDVLFIGSNNVGKSTICEALDLTLGPDRLSKFPPIEEFDFYNSVYVEEEKKDLRKIRVEVVLTELSEEISKRAGGHLEYWYAKENRILTTGELALTDDPSSSLCLRMETLGLYNVEEDEFEAQTFFSHSPTQEEGTLQQVPKAVKRAIGFIYLRTLRTGSRALSLERGSLFDVILRLGNIKAGLWEETIKTLKNLNPSVDEKAPNLRPLLDALEMRIGQYIPLNPSDKAASLFVSNLTRENLRKTLSFFLSISPDQVPVPFQEVGTGTLNTLVLALLSFIAEMKEDVIFAMEEPEIALPPHSQRRIVNYLIDETSQCFVTSHSPYVIEMFDPDSIYILNRKEGALSASRVVVDGQTIKPKLFKKHARRGLCEVMLGKGVIVVEGITEQFVFWSVTKKMEHHNPDFYPVDLSGVTIFSTDGDGSMPEYGMFFQSIGLKTYAFYDFKKDRSVELKEKFSKAFNLNHEISHVGIEALLADEVPVSRQWQLLQEIRDSGRLDSNPIPKIRPADGQIKLLTVQVLKALKGEGTAGRLIDMCEFAELPSTVTAFVRTIYQAFPKPIIVPVPKFQPDAQQTLQL